MMMPCQLGSMKNTHQKPDAAKKNRRPACRKKLGAKRKMIIRKSADNARLLRFGAGSGDAG